MSPQQFCLRWNNHQSNIISVFEHLLQTEAFVDVSLAVEGMTLKAHKVVLSACSPYFQAVLASHPDKHPVVILKDVKYSDMRDLLDFMYRGEVSVDQDNLTSFLRVATSLRIKGLTEVNEKKPGSSPPPFLFQGVVGPNHGDMVPSAPLTPIAGDPPPLKRSPLSPINSYGAKRRRGRPPKISGEESDGELGSVGGSVSATEGEDTRSETEVKVEVEDGDITDTEKDSEAKGSETGYAGPSGEPGNKDDVEHSKDVISSDWTMSEAREDSSSLNGTSNQLSTNLPTTTLIQKSSENTTGTPSGIQLSNISDIDNQYYYTKNLIEAAMLNPYDSLKTEKGLQGSILLASLRSQAPLKYGIPNLYRDKDHDQSEPQSTSSHAVCTTSGSNSTTNTLLASMRSQPLKYGLYREKDQEIDPTYLQKPQSTSISGTGGTGTSTTSSTANAKGITVPIMSYCIQDNGFKCSKCFQTFTHPSNFHRHYITVHTDRRAHKCHVCGKEFKRKDNMMSHIRSVHRPGKEGHNIFREAPPTGANIFREATPTGGGIFRETPPTTPGIVRDAPGLSII